MKEPIRRPRPPHSGDVSPMLHYLRQLESYATALECIIRPLQQEGRMIPHDAQSADSLVQQLADLRAMVARLQTALAWYADVSNYDDQFAPGVVDPQDGTWHIDCGARARAALKEKT